jgi:hypothetical protein
VSIRIICRFVKSEVSCAYCNGNCNFCIKVSFD